MDGRIKEMVHLLYTCGIHVWYTRVSVSNVCLTTHVWDTREGVGVGVGEGEGEGEGVGVQQGDAPPKTNIKKKHQENGPPFVLGFRV